MNEIFNKDTFLTFFIALLLGLFLGVFYNSNYSITFRMYVHNIYTKLHPEIEKESINIIIDKASSSSKGIPQNDIFEKNFQDNKFVCFIKKIFFKPKKQTIFDNY